MADKTISVQVPAELSFLADLAQGIIDDVIANKAWTAVVSSALPALFAEGVKLEDLKAELKSPKVWTLAGLLLGSVAAKVLADKAASKVAAAAQAVAAEAQPAGNA